MDRRWVALTLVFLVSGWLCGSMEAKSPQERSKSGRRRQVTNYIPVGRPDSTEVDLLLAIMMPFTVPSVDYVTGRDGFPAFQLKENSDIKAQYRLLFPETLFTNFAIVATFKMEDRIGGYLFSVVNPSETVVQLGLKLAPFGESFQNVTLYYTDVDMHLSSQVLVSFVVPESVDVWTRLALKVVGNNVTLYYNCEEYSTAVVKRIPKRLVFDTASTVYVGQAGSLLKGNYVVSSIPLCVTTVPPVNGRCKPEGGGVNMMDNIPKHDHPVTIGIQSVTTKITVVHEVRTPKERKESNRFESV